MELNQEDNNWCLVDMNWKGTDESLVVLSAGFFIQQFRSLSRVGRAFIVASHSVLLGNPISNKKFNTITTEVFDWIIFELVKGQI